MVMSDSGSLYHFKEVNATAGRFTSEWEQLVKRLLSSC